MRNGLVAVIFDWAGTTIDFGCIGPVMSFVEAFRLKDIDITIDEARLPMGLAKWDHTKKILEIERVRELWIDEFDEEPEKEDIDDIYSSLEPMLAKIVKDYSTPVPGCIGLVEELRYRGIKIGTTTGYVESMMRNIIPIANGHGFVPDSVVNSSEVPQGRPFPWMCHKNALNMGVYPMGRMIKIGDTVADIEEGINAGMWTIGVTVSGNEVGISFEDLSTTGEDELSSLITVAEQKLLGAGAHYAADGIWDCLPIIEEIEQRILNGEKP